MDTLDNANANPFAINNSNSDIILQKEGLLLDLAKQNGEPTTNGKRPAHEEFDDDDDLGPETDVDAMDDVLVSPATHKHLDNNTEEEKATLETEHIKHDSVKVPSREETSTPPADLVHATSGLVDNVADSCEDSDDEWNYFKGEIRDKENVPPCDTDKEVCVVIDNDEMSHLNPNAAEFVPLSPKGRADSPALVALMNEPLIAQSPKRGTAPSSDIKVPDVQEFESEIKCRPSDINETNEEGEYPLSTEEIMLNFLNGKNAEDIEFHPVSTPIKTFKADEFHFGPNATPFSTPAKFDTSEALSTKAVFGDESTASYLEKGFDSSYACSEFSKSQVTKEKDPMSTSFYHDKDNVDDTNPFDLNRVHDLPDNIDEFLNKEAEDSFFNETISDLPEHDAALVDSKKLPELVLQQAQHEFLDVFATQEVAKSPVHDEVVEQLTDLDLDYKDVSAKSPVNEHFPRVSSQSPVSQLSPSGTPAFSDHTELHFLLENSVSSQSPVPRQSPGILQSPTPPQSPRFAQSPIPTPSPVPPQSPILAKSPTPTQSPTPQPPFGVLSQHEELLVRQAHLPEVLACTKAEPIYAQIPEPIDAIPILPESPVPANESPLVVKESPTAIISHDLLVDASDIIPTSHSPLPHEIESPLEDVTSSIKDFPLLASSPLGNIAEDDDDVNVIQQVVNLIQETITDSSLAFNDDEFLSPQSKIETESIATTDVNSFLERSLLPDVASPLSPTEQEDTIIASSIIEPGVQLPLLDVVVKTEVIAPEFPVQQEIITTPTDTIIKSVEQKKSTTTKPRVSGTSTSASAAIGNKPTSKTATTRVKPAAKTLVKTAPATAKPAPVKATLVKTSTTPVSSPKPAGKPSTKPPATNGVAKAPVACTLTKTTSATTASAKPVPSKTARPATAPTAKPPAKQPIAPATSRPATLMSKTSTTTMKKTTTVTSAVTNNKSTAKPTTATSPKEPPKIRQTTAAAGVLASARPKSSPAKPLTKTPDTEKSIKEAVNKQTASRTAAAATKTIRKVEPKVPPTRTSVTKTTTTAVKGTGETKKPQELVRHATTKTKVTKTTVKDTKVHQNGIENEIITVTSTTTIEEPQLIIKDVSPIIENSQLLD